MESISTSVLHDVAVRSAHPTPQPVDAAAFVRQARRVGRARHSGVELALGAGGVDVVRRLDRAPIPPAEGTVPE